MSDDRSVDTLEVEMESIEGDDASASRGRPIRAYVYGGILTVLGIVLGVNFVHVWALESELQAIADERIDEFKAEEPPETADELRIGASVVASKSYLVAGDVSGKCFCNMGSRSSRGASKASSFSLCGIRTGRGVRRRAAGARPSSARKRACGCCGAWTTSSPRGDAILDRRYGLGKSVAWPAVSVRGAGCGFLVGS